MTHVDRQKLVKLLNLTRSDNDHEALAAIRRVNLVVPDWAEFFGGQDIRAKLQKQYGHATPERRVPTRESWTPMVSEMLDDCVERVRGNGATFIESLAQQYHDKGYITPKQNEALEKFWRNLD